MGGGWEILSKILYGNPYDLQEGTLSRTLFEQLLSSEELIGIDDSNHKSRIFILNSIGRGLLEQKSKLEQGIIKRAYALTETGKKLLETFLC